LEKEEGRNEVVVLLEVEVEVEEVMVVGLIAHRCVRGSKVDVGVAMLNELATGSSRRRRRVKIDRPGGIIWLTSIACAGGLSIYRAT
jgi:hypothetical protein